MSDFHLNHPGTTPSGPDADEKILPADAGTGSSDAKFRALFNAIDDAIATVRVIYDEAGAAVDCLLLEHNPAWARLIRIPDAAGKRASELFASAESSWAEMLRQLLSLQEGQRFEQHFSRSDRWFDVYATPIDGAGSHDLCVVMSDISERKRSALRDAYLVKLTDAVTPLNAPDSIAAAASTVLGIELGVQWIVYGEAIDIEGTTYFRPAAHFTADRNLPMGPFEAEDFDAAIATLEQGHDLVIDDAETAFPEPIRGRFRELGVRSLAVVPLVKNGRLLFTFGAYHPHARAWTPEAIKLIRLTAERTWMALERAKSEQELRNSEAQLRVTMESATDYAIISTNVQGIIEGWSAGAELIFGYRADEARGRSANLIFTPEDVADGAPEREMHNARTRGWAADERWHIRRDGTRFYMSGVMRPIMNPDLRGYVKVARDMTDQQEAAERLRVSEERHRVALLSGGMATWDWNVWTDQITWNDLHYVLLGLAPDGRPRTPDEFLDHVFPADREILRASLNEAAASAGLINTEFRIIRHDDASVRWMQGYGKTIDSEDGRATRIIGVMYDITTKKELEQQKDQFISIASHELKTPVTSIKSYAEILRAMLDEGSDRRSAALMHKLDLQIDRLADLVRALLDVTRIREGRLELKPETFELRGLLEEVQAEMTYTTRTAIELRRDGPAPVFAERERIRQVLTNLLSNAIRYSPAGAPVVIGIRRDGTRAVVSVRDFGPGIAPQFQHQIFERYFQTDTAIDRHSAGLGLGLFIAADIIHRHGGEIWVERPADGGALVAFSLPLTDMRPE